MIRFTIPGLPIPKGRPRLSKWGTYTPKRTKEYEAHVAECWDAEHGERQPMNGPVHIKLEFMFEPPKSANKRDRLAMLENRTPCTNPSDLDNLIKSVADAINGRAYVDDRQIVELSASKEWAEVACCVVQIREVTDGR